MLKIMSSSKSLISSTVCLLLFCFSLVGCSSVENTQNEIDNEKVSIFTGRPGGISLSGLTNGKATSNPGLPVNALLWRAALDIASFVPLDDVDTFGGSIITEWYQNSAEDDQRLKLTFFVSGLELRSDAIGVRAYIQKKQEHVWVDAGQDEKLARRLEDLVLMRARELRSATVEQSVK